jgi:hypothetical protein
MKIGTENYTLRWLFYRKIPNFTFGSTRTDKWKASERCSKCKWGVNNRMSYSYVKEDGTLAIKTYCPHCGAKYVSEPNTNISHKLYRLGKNISNLFWNTLDALHLIRSAVEGRYGMFGDEAMYVNKWTINLEKSTTLYTLLKRKWWQHILIIKKK